MADRDVHVHVKTTSDTRGARAGQKAIDDTGKSAGKLNGALTGAAVGSGKLGAGLKALAGPAGIAVAAVLALLAAIRKLKDAAESFGEQELLDKRQEAVLRATGAAANLTAGQLEHLRQNMADLSGISDETIESVQSLLLTFRQIKGDEFERATESALDLAEVLGGDAMSGAIMLGKALQDPTTGLTALTRAGVTFTEQQKEQIRAMHEAGQVAEAQRMILAELESQVGGVAKATGETYARTQDKIKNATNDLNQALGEYVAKLKVVQWWQQARLRITRDLIEALQQERQGADMLETTYDGLGDTTERLNEELEDVAENVGDAHKSAAALADELERSTKAAAKTAENLDKLTDARLAAKEAEVEAQVAAGAITPGQGAARIAELRAGANQEKFNRREETLRNQLAAANAAVVQADKESAEARQALAAAQKTYDLDLTNVLRHGNLSAAERSAVQSGSPAEASAALRAAGGRAGPRQQTMFNLLTRSRGQLDTAAAGVRSAAERRTGVRKRALPQISQAQANLELLGFQRTAGRHTAAAARSRAASRQRAEQLRANIGSTQKQIASIEAETPGIVENLQARAEREQSEAVAAEANVEQMQASGRVGRTSLRSFSGQDALREAQTLAQRERDEANAAAAEIANTIRQSTETLHRLRTELETMRAELRNSRD